MSNPNNQGPTPGFPYEEWGSRTPPQDDVTQRSQPQIPMQPPYPARPSEPQFSSQAQYPPQPPYPTQPSQPQYPQYPYPTQPQYPMYPAQQPMQPPTPPQQRKWFRPRNIAIGCGVLLVACIAISGVALALGNAGGNSANTPPTATTAATNTPAATRDPNAGWQDYVHAVRPDLDVLANDFGAIGTDCGKSDLTACDNDAKKLSTDAQTAQHDLDTHPAPPCLKAVDTQLRSIYALLDRAGTEASKGIEQNESNLLEEAAQDIQTATKQMQQTTNALTTVTCA